MEPTEFWQREFEYQREESMHRSEISNSIGQSALKSMMLVNGGAILSILTFVGNNGKVTDAHNLKVAMAMFGLGLFCVLLAHAAAYFAQNDFMQVAAYRAENAHSRLINGPAIEVPPKHFRRGNATLIAAIILVLASLLLFGLGAWYALSAII